MNRPLLRRAIVSGADAAYFPLLADLVDSLTDRGARQSAALCILDLGLKPFQKEWLASHEAIIVAPGWDLVVSEETRTRPGYMAMTARPFLPRHFPGHDVYLWLDSDIWVQRPDALDPFWLGASRHPLAIVPELGRSYYSLYGDNGARQMHRQAYRTAFGEDAGDKLMRFPILNSGAFAATADSPIWETWQEFAASAMANGQLKHSEQAALNAAVYSRNLRPEMLPARFNWVCTLSVPAFDPETKLLVEPEAPHDPLELVHLCGAPTRLSISRTDGEPAEEGGLGYGHFRGGGYTP